MTAVCSALSWSGNPQKETDLSEEDLILVAGAGGFIGGHIVRDLRRRGHKAIRAVDVKPPDRWCQYFSDADNRRLDLRKLEACREAAHGARIIINLAADTGGAQFGANNKTACMLSVLINTHLLMAARDAGTERFFFSSSASVYATRRQTDPDVIALREEDAYPAMAEDGHGWEKLFSERMCRHFRDEHGLMTHMARYHNVYGPNGIFDGGRERAPAAICRKVIQAKLAGHHEIDIWGDGEQTRSFMYIDDCVLGTQKIMEAGIEEPINLGRDELVTINQLVDIAERIAGITVKRRYKFDAPQGVRGRSSDNNRIRAKIGWAPEIRLAEGLERTYRWIYNRLALRNAA